MKNYFLFNLIFLSLCLSQAEARIGGGRSFGSRGSRSVAPRAYQATPQRPNAYSQAAPNRMNPAPQAQPPMQSTTSSGGFLRSMAGGLAGGMIGSMLFRGIGGYGAGMGQAGGGGFGFLELLLLGGGLFLLFRWFMARQAVPTSSGENVTAYSRYPTPELAQADAYPEATRGEDGPNFDPNQFKEQRIDDFFKLQAALMHRDLRPVKEKVTPEIYAVLENDIATLRSSGKLNKLENITVRETEIMETWHEPGKEYASLRIRANLLDYSVDEKTGALVGGSDSEPVKFEECWTFVRDISESAAPTAWRLTAVEQMTN